MLTSVISTSQVSPFCNCSPMSLSECRWIFKEANVLLNYWAATCDIHQCGILASVDSDEPVQPPIRLRNSKWCLVSSLTLLEYSSDEQRLWSDNALRRLIWGFAGHIYHTVGNLMSRLNYVFYYLNPFGIFPKGLTTTRSFLLGSLYAFSLILHIAIVFMLTELLVYCDSHIANEYLPLSYILLLFEHQFISRSMKREVTLH